MNTKKCMDKNVKYLRKTDYVSLWHSGREVAKILGVWIWSDDMLCETSKQICHNWNVALLQKFSSKKKYPSALNPPFYSDINIFA